MNTPVATADSPRREDEGLRTLDGYRLLRRIGRGGMSTVFLGYDTRTDSPVAVKVLAEHLSFDPRFVRRFRREGHLAKMSRHPHVARGVALGQDRASGLHYLALEYIDGLSVQQLLDRSGRLPVPEACRIVGEAAEGLEYLATLHYLHRDVKPANILLDSKGRAKLIDFGLSVRADERDGLDWEPGRYGTPYYMPPEQADGGRADIRGDIFALAGTLYHMLTGEVPFPGADAAEVMRKKLEQPPIPAQLCNPQVPVRLSHLLARSLAVDPAARPKSMAEFAARLRQFRGERDRSTSVYRPAANAPLTTRTDELAVTQPDPCGVRNELPARSDVSRDPRRKSIDPPRPPATRRWRTGAVVLALCLILGSSAAFAADWFGAPAAAPSASDRLPVCPCESLSWDGGLTPDEIAELGPADLASSSVPLTADPCPPLPEMPALR